MNPEKVTHLNQNPHFFPQQEKNPEIKKNELRMLRGRHWWYGGETDGEKDKGWIREGTTLLLLGLTLSSPTVRVCVWQRDKSMTHAYLHRDPKDTQVTLETSAAQIRIQRCDHVRAH